MAKLQELREELATVFSGRGVKLIDSLAPLIVYLILNQLWSIKIAFIGSIAAALIFFIYRLIKRDNLFFALAGIAAVAVAAGLALLSDSQVGYFLPGLISGGITIVLLIGSVLIGKPIAAWTSQLTRRWPMEWYWHPRIKPAYTEVTLIWAITFGLRSGLEYWLFTQDAIGLLGAAKVLMGWPYTILILVLSYIYGIWRLGALQGPSVEEFKQGDSPPWEGQKRGF